ncbi:MAG: ATP-dependent helicase [Candidatus Thiodiazotropha weberae]|nr:ATP-dependent helicase [Candidatus Thiodiazotropha lotti]MCG8020893.1 ATP-dependent helicase [Candidatus Thiodiazotropha lotti]MCW4208059.1 ATP-dependent helicase [Candidatus Thiodiazotropha lotti]MCW4216546.1 ATP-dependent helicase [Candidatus Thiodiazotropha lotti]
MIFVPPKDWRPRDIEDLEHNAWKALRHSESTCVVAGPGAGKTEFLAQRAVYLLETGLCRPPYRILAISFKTDAASNLAARVRQRCPPELAERFVSVTFDAFTKSLVDRFLTAIPQVWRPTRPYDVAFPKRRQVQDFLTTSRLSAPVEWQAAIAGLGASDFESRFVGGYRLPLEHRPPMTGIEFTIGRWWFTQLPAGQCSSLTFVGLNRLAELLLRSNPHILRALQATYPFVFVDEFQDTTFAQYDFLLSAFGRENTVITAVGDNKQRIMTFAGARKDAFPRFQADFVAELIPLLFNFRSSPDLVAIQHVVARALDSNASETVARATRKVDGNVVQVWCSQTITAEATHLAHWLANDIAVRGREACEYALLVKQKSDEYERELTGYFAAQGLRIRNESHTLGRTTLQDLLSDEFCHIMIAILRLGSVRRAPAAWQLASSSVLALRTVAPDDDVEQAKVETNLTVFLNSLRADMAAIVPSHASAYMFATRVLEYLDQAAVAQTYIEYSTGDILEIMIEAFYLHFLESSEGASDWTACLDAFEGISQIPMMTVHKSKGLEYDTIVFIGLDDQAWWAHTPGDPEGIAAFFVALSRAKQRAIFAFCQERGERNKVGELYQLLTNAGVPEILI